MTNIAYDIILDSAKYNHKPLQRQRCTVLSNTELFFIPWQ
jgi:hypothetical protein